MNLKAICSNLDQAADWGTAFRPNRVLMISFSVFDEITAFCDEIRKLQTWVKDFEGKVVKSACKWQPRSSLDITRWDLISKLSIFDLRSASWSSRLLICSNGDKEPTGEISKCDLRWRAANLYLI